MKRFPKKFRALPPAVLAVTGLTGFHEVPPEPADPPPNILLIMVDQMQFPPSGYGQDEGAVQELKEILGFRPLTPGNTYAQYFEGFMRLRQNSVILKTHYTASAASVPSRSCIMTGQYPSLTHVTQTDGLFKTQKDVPYLDSLGAPTLGDWFRAAGYSTHYFGKWHVSEAEPPRYLEPWGFADWEQSYPEPHGGTSSNLGAFRDVVFTENVIRFLQNRGTDTAGGPWFAVGSLVNPHDVSSWPINWMVPPDSTGVVLWQNYPPPPVIPAPGSKSRVDTVTMIVNGVTVERIFQVDLNPDGFPQQNSFLPPTYRESLEDKPWCQQDYAYKWGLAFGAKTDLGLIQQQSPFRSPLPFQLQGTSDSAWSLGYVQFYFYLHYLADLQIRQILQALDENNLTDNTIVVFMSDHGEMTAAHGGLIQKWHNAYEESIHVPVVVSSPLVNADPQEMREILQTTSSVDLAPTLLALAGLDEDQLRATLVNLYGPAASEDFPGADLSAHLKGTATGPIIGPDGQPRTGVLFMGHDMITELGTVDPNPQKTLSYNLFRHRVDSTIALGYSIDTGCVRQPNNMNAFCTGDWKLVQYDDPTGVEEDQWELYCLVSDPLEEINLVDYRTGIVRSDVSVSGMTPAELAAKNEELRNRLFQATGVTEQPVLPTAITLYQNIPNPFHQNTNIPFYLPESCLATLTVTDLAGKEAVVVVNKKLLSGFHTYDLDATSLPSGVYLVKLSAGSQQAVRKMILVR